LLLQASIKYEQDDTQLAKSLLRSAGSDDGDANISEGCILYKQGKFEDALKKFQDGLNLLGWQAELGYNLALC